MLERIKDWVDGAQVNFLKWRLDRRLTKQAKLDQLPKTILTQLLTNADSLRRKFAATKKH